MLGTITGAVAGLVAITPAAGSVRPMGAIGVGLGAGLFAYLAVTLIKPLFNYDDSLDVFGVHGIAGIWGAIAAGLFATNIVPGNDTNGLFNGNADQVLIQPQRSARRTRPARRAPGDGDAGGRARSAEGRG